MEVASGERSRSLQMRATKIEEPLSGPSAMVSPAFCAVNAVDDGDDAGDGASPVQRVSGDYAPGTTICRPTLTQISRA